jgi:ABC-type transport system involved in cytochrome c biogenesis permease component
MPEVTIDWLGILVATVAAMVIGGLWYGPLFGKQWMGYIGKTPEQLKAQGPGLGYVAALLSSLLTAIVSTYVTQWATADGFLEGVAVGAIIWLGYTIGGVVVGGVFEGRPWGLIMLNSGNALVTIALVSGIVAAFADYPAAAALLTR